MEHKEASKTFVEALGLSEPPIAVYYSDEKPEGADEWDCQGNHFCHIGRMEAVRQGTPLAVDGENPGCGGAAYYLGWKEGVMPGFEYFLSHNEKGEGERFVKTPELARDWIENRTFVKANGRYCIFVRLEDLPESITPEVVILYVDPDEISGLVSLANYGRKGQNSVIAPFSSGCGSTVNEPRVQAKEAEPKAVLGMFDLAARQRINMNHLTFSMPYSMFIEMIENIPGSFLEIEPWLTLKKR